MTTNDHTLPREVIFGPDGHLAEVALSCVADGQLDLVPAAALAHLDGCDHCAHLLGEAALLSVSAGEALADLAPRSLLAVPVALGETPKPPARALAPAVVSTPVPTPSARARARRPLPVAAIAAALLVALVTAAPSLLDAVQGAPGMLSAASSTLPFLFRVASAFARAPWEQGSAGILIECASALVLLMIGLQVARVTSRARSFQREGGV
jgi:hypothetical protein